MSDYEITERLKNLFIKYYLNYRNYEVAYLKNILGDDNTTGNDYLDLRIKEMNNDYIDFNLLLKEFISRYGNK